MGEDRVDSRGRKSEGYVVVSNMNDIGNQIITAREDEMRDPSCGEAWMAL